MPFERHSLGHSSPSSICRPHRGALVAWASHRHSSDASWTWLYGVGCMQLDLRPADRLDCVPDFRAFEATRSPAAVTGHRSCRSARRNADLSDRHFVRYIITGISLCQAERRSLSRATSHHKLCVLLGSRCPISHCGTLRWPRSRPAVRAGEGS